MYKTKARAGFSWLFEKKTEVRWLAEINQGKLIQRRGAHQHCIMVYHVPCIISQIRLIMDTTSFIYSHVHSFCPFLD